MPIQNHDQHRLEKDGGDPRCSSSKPFLLFDVKDMHTELFPQTNKEILKKL